MSWGTSPGKHHPEGPKANQTSTYTLDRSMGTDHGAANNVYVIGDRLKKPGMYNGTTDLSDLDAGDVRHKVDFRSIYAELLDHWLDTDHTAILRNTFEKTRLIS